MAKRRIRSEYRSWVRGVLVLGLWAVVVVPVPAQTISDASTHDRIKVGDAPIAAAFDGENIWVVNDGSNSVTKVRASDSTVLGTYSVGLSSKRSLRRHSSLDIGLGQSLR